MVIPGKVTPVPAPLRGRSPDTGDSGHTADAKFFAVFNQLLHLDARHFTQALMSLVWVETL